MNYSLSFSRGFTVVELLIVVVVISILATIMLVSYGNIQDRANNASSESTASTLSRKIQNYATAKGAYPTTTNGVITTDLAMYPDSSAKNLGITIGTPTAATGKTTVKVELCGAGAGVKITRWDYETRALTAKPILLGTTTGTCVLATA